MTFNKYNKDDYIYIDIKKSKESKYDGDFFMYCGYCEKIMLRSAKTLHSKHERHISNKSTKNNIIPSNDEIINLIKDWIKFYSK